MVMNGCHDAGRGLAERREPVGGDFFPALGLASLDGLVDLTRGWRPLPPGRGGRGVRRR